MKLFYIVSTLFIFIGLPTLAFAQGATQEIISQEKQEYYKIEIDCYDGNVSNMIRHD